MYCSNCKNEFSDNAIACPSCGEPTKNSLSNEAADKKVSNNYIIAAYISGFVLPVAGFAFTIYLLTKHRVSHAIGVGLTSVFFFYFWYSAFVSMPGSAAFTWECEATGPSATQCQINNDGPGSGSLTFEIVAYCEGAEHRALVSTGEMEAGRIVQRVARFEPEIRLTATCDGFEYRNETVK